MSVGGHPRDVLRYHVTGAIERGEGVAIEEIPANPVSEFIVRGSYGDIYVSKKTGEVLRIDGHQGYMGEYDDIVRFNPDTLIGVTAHGVTYEETDIVRTTYFYRRPSGAVGRCDAVTDDELKSLRSKA